MCICFFPDDYETHLRTMHEIVLVARQTCYGSGSGSGSGTGTTAFKEGTITPLLVARGERQNNAITICRHCGRAKSPGTVNEIN